MHALVRRKGYPEYTYCKKESEDQFEPCDKENEAQTEGIYDGARHSNVETDLWRRLATVFSSFPSVQAKVDISISV